MTALLLLGLILAFYTIVLPVARCHAMAEKDLLQQRLRRAKLAAVRRRFPILGGLSDRQLEEEFNIDWILYSP